MSIKIPIQPEIDSAKLKSESTKAGKIVENEFEKTGKNAGNSLYNGISKKLGDLKGGLSDSFASLKGGDIQGSIGGLVGSVTSFAGAWGVAGAAIVGVGAKIYDVVAETMKLQNQVSQLTGLTGNQLSSVTANVSAISKTFDASFEETLKAANSLAKGMGIPIEEAMKAIEDGFINGANSGGEFLAQLTEYPTFFKEAGLNAQQMGSYIAEASKQGIFADKGGDLIKESTLRLREMTQGTKDALKGIGLSGDEIQAALNDGTMTIFEAMQKVTGKMAELPPKSAAVGTAIADIFGGPGEDVGLPFLLNLSRMNLQTELLTENMTYAQRELKSQLDTTKAWELILNGITAALTPLIVGIKEFVAGALWSMIKGFDALRSVVGVLTDNLDYIIPVISAMTIAFIAQNATLIATKLATLALSAVQGILAAKTAIVTAATWAWSVALNSTGIPLIIIAIGALVAGLIYAYKHFEGFRNVVNSVANTIKGFISGLAEAVGWMDIFGDKAAEEQEKKQKVIRDNQKKNYQKFRSDIKTIKDESDKDELLKTIELAKQNKKISEGGYEDLKKKIEAVTPVVEKQTDAIKKQGDATKETAMTIEDYIKALVKLDGAEFDAMFQKALKLKNETDNLADATNKIKFQIDFASDKGFADFAKSLNEYGIGSLDNLTDSMIKSDQKGFWEKQTQNIVDASEKEKKTREDNYNHEKAIREQREADEAKSLEKKKEKYQTYIDFTTQGLDILLSTEKTNLGERLKAFSLFLVDTIEKQSIAAITKSLIDGLAAGTMTFGASIVQSLLYITGIKVAAAGAKALLGAEDGTDFGKPLNLHKGKPKGKDSILMAITPDEYNFGIMSDKALSIGKNREYAQMMNKGINIESMVLRNQSNLNDVNIVRQLQASNQRLERIERSNMEVAKRFNSNSTVNVNTKQDINLKVDNMGNWRY